MTIELNRQTIAVVEDESDISDLIALHLRKNMFEVKQFHSANTFLTFLQNGSIDLILLDLMLPDLDGMDICKFLKSNDKYKNIPILILTARQDETDKVIGLEMGADDYVTKPFSPRELIARVKAVLRRSGGSEERGSTSDDGILTISDEIVIDNKKYIVTDKNKKEINLTTTEFKILATLASKKGWVYSREKLLNSVWGEDRYVIDRTVDVHIKHLREKLGSAGRFIKNVRGVGYKLEE